MLKITKGKYLLSGAKFLDGKETSMKKTPDQAYNTQKIIDM